jgi:release factor glutamine methyltransferase
LNPTVGALLDEGAQALDLRGDDSRREAQILLGHALGASRAWLIAHRDDATPAGHATRYRHLVERRCRGEPVAYLIGRREFHGLDFRVTPDVLIPRADTETLVDAALGLVADRAGTAILDLGTGSGCIATVLAVRLPNAKVTAVDSSARALRVARANADAHSAQVEFLEGDWFAPLGTRKFDLIVSNPPYVPVADPHLERGDLRFEPAGALVSGPDGLSDIRRIVVAAPAHLHPEGRILLEHGHQQADRCASLLKEAGFQDLASFPDLAGIRRVTGGRLVRSPASR